MFAQSRGSTQAAENKKMLSLAQRLLLSIVLVSLVSMLVAVFIQWGVVYKREFKLIDDRLRYISASYLPSLSENVWFFNDSLVQTQLEGLLQLPDVKYVEIRSLNGPIYSAGSSPSSSQVLLKTYQLEHTENGKTTVIGKLDVTVDLSNVYQRILDQLLSVLEAQALLFFLLSGLILLISSQLITQPLNTIAGYLRQLELEDLGRPLVLGSAVTQRNDELGRLATAINDMRERMALAIEARNRAEEILNRQNRELQAISLCNQALLRIDDEQSLLSEICRIICEEAGYHMAWVGFAENDMDKTVRPAAWAGAEDGYLNSAKLTWADTERGRGPVGVAIREGKIIPVQDFSTDPLVTPWQSEGLARGYHSAICLPLKDEYGVAFGVLVIYSSQINAFISSEIKLLAQLAGDLAFGITAIRTRSKRKQAEQALQKWGHIFEHAGTGIVVDNADAEHVDMMNPAYAHLHGYSAEEMTGIPIMDHFAPAVRNKLPEYFRLTHEKGHITYESEQLRKDGSIFPVEVDITEVKDKSGNVLYRVSTVKDISERKQIERLRGKEAERNQVLLQLERQTREWTEEEIFQYILQKVVTLTESQIGTIHQVTSEQEIRLLSVLNNETLQNKHESDPDWCSAMTETWTECVKEKRPVIHNDYSGSDIDIKEGTKGPDRRLGVPILDGDQVRLIVCVGNKGSDYNEDDLVHLKIVTNELFLIIDRKRSEQLIRVQNQELKQAYENLNQSNAELDKRVRQRTQELTQANAELEAFSYSVSHDLRAPLRSINGFGQLLLDDYSNELDDTGKSYLQKIRSASNKMGGLIDDLLKLFRISRTEIEFEAVNLSQIAEQISSSLTISQPEHNVSWIITPGLWVKGDKGLLSEAIENLLANAWKFTSKCDKAVIEFGSLVEEQRIIYFVRDNGVGFNASRSNKLFEPFTRMHHEKDFEGTGIGLSIVKRIIVHHGGKIWAEGEENMGATFYFTL